jgi:capsular exopolysaccharide synthesis family protein
MFTNGHSNNRQVPEKPATQNERELSLRDLVEILYKSRWLIAACFAVVVALTAAYTFTSAPEYEARSTLQVNTQNATPQIGELFGFENAFRNVLNEIQILKSRTIAERVAEELVARPLPLDGPDFSVLEPPDDGTELTVAGVIARLRDSYVKIVPLSQDVDFIEIVVTSTNPEEAAEIARLYAETYLEYNRRASRERMKVAVDYLSGVTDDLFTDLQTSENSLSGFRSDESVVDPIEEARSLIQQKASLEGLRVEAESELQASAAEVGVLEEQLDAILPGLASRLSSGGGLTVERMAARIAELQVELEEKKAKNPQLVQNPQLDPTYVQELAQVKALQEQLDARARTLVENAGLSSSGESALSSEETLERITEIQGQLLVKRVMVRALEARLEPLKQNLAAIDATLIQLPERDIQLSRLNRTVETRASLYTELLKKLQEARIAEQSELGYIEIVDNAVVPTQSVRPRIPLNLALGALLGLLLGVAASFVRNALDNKVRRPEDVRRAGLNVIGAIPNLSRIIKSDFDGQKRVTLNGGRYDTALVTLLNPLSPISEGYRRLRTNIQYNDPDREMRVIMVTSAEPGEGKTVTSSNLAVAFAQSGRRTVYVDADLRRASGHKMYGISREPGLVELLFDPTNNHIESFRSTIDDLYMIPAGRNVPNPAEVLESMRMRDLLRMLREEFDIVVVDTPPVLAVADALLLSRQTDACVMVCSANSTNFHALESSAQMLRDVDAPVVGVVLNKLERSSSSSYSYGYSYHSYYGDRPTAAA